jgi:hypothetical protein
MAASQISTSVTIINSLLGFQSISLTEMDSSAATVITDGSKVEVASAFFNFTTDSTPQATTWTAITTTNTAYITLLPTGSAGTQTLTARWSETAPEWNDTKQGWYASAGSTIRYIGGCVKGGATVYDDKFLLAPFNNRLKLGGPAGDTDTWIDFASDAKLVWNESANVFTFNKGVGANGKYINETTTDGSVFTVLSSYIPTTAQSMLINGVIDPFVGGPGHVMYAMRNTATQILISYWAFATGSGRSSTYVNSGGTNAMDLMITW